MSLPLITENKLDTPDITPIRPSKVGQLDIADTKAFKQTVAVEVKLQKIFSTILDTMLKSGNDITQIRFDYNNVIYDYWYGAIQNVYIIATNYTNDAHSTVPRFTGKDGDQVKKLTDYATGKFFLKIDKYLRREQDIERSDYFFSIQDRITKMIQESSTMQASNLTIEPKQTNLKPLAIDKQIDNLVTSILFMTLNIGVLQKTRQLNNLKSGEQTVAFSGSLIGDAISAFGNLIAQGIRGLFKIGNTITGQSAGAIGGSSLLQSRAKNAQATSLIMWVTKMDEKVCFKYCEPLDGDKFDAADPNHPVPIISTHPNCRCRLLNTDANGNVLADGVDAI